MNQQDLRVIKTKENIETAFLSLLKKKPLEKITVTELAQTARISKGTFYLHYQDIYNLYNKLIENFFEKTISEMDFFPLFFDNPIQFMDMFGEIIKRHFNDFKVLLQNRSETTFQPKIAEMLRKRIYAVGRIQPSIKNDIRLDAVINCIFFLMPNYSGKHPSEVQEVIAEMILQMFNIT